MKKQQNKKSTMTNQTVEGKISEESVEHFLTVIDCYCHKGLDNNWDKQSFKKAVEYTKEWVKYRLPKKLK